VYAIDDSGDIATKKRIRIGRQNPESYEVLDGLEPGDRVIVSTYENFGDFEKLILSP
jgi:HlyD family secretion protein